MDLVTQIIKNKLSGGSLSANFHFTLHASFENESQAIGLNLLLAAAKRCSEQFTLKLRFSQNEGQRSARWGEEYLLTNLPTQVERVWVCGPPEMTRKFQSAFEALSDKFAYLKDPSVALIL